MATNGLQRNLRTLREANDAERIQALTSLRRYLLENPNTMNKISEEDFCDLCNSIINASAMDNGEPNIEACRTLDIVLPHIKDKNFDFFESILQINRKKRLKILESLDILKDETLARIAGTSSVLVFVNDSLQSIQMKTMPWLLPENSENVLLLKNAENANESYEDKIVVGVLKLLSKICTLSGNGLNVRPFDLVIMDKVILLANMGHCKQRSAALMVFEQAVKNDLGLRVKSMHKIIWEQYKSTLQNHYCKRMAVLVNSGTLDWASLWETTITFIGTDLHRGSGLVNSLLKVEEHAFRSADPNRRQAFLSWKVLIDNFSMDQRELATNRRIKLLCTPLHAKNSKTETMVLTKLEVWWHLICRIYPSLSELVDTVLWPYLTTCFGPFSEKPIFAQKSEPNVSLGKKFFQTQLFAVDTFLQLIVSKEDQLELPSSNVQKLPDTVGNSVFEKMHKVFIHCFGEIVLILAQLPEKEGSFVNKTKVCEILWNNLIKRIEAYDKMRTLMYKEVTIVLSELFKRFHKIKLVKDFFMDVLLKNFHSIADHIHFSEATMLDFLQLFLQVDNFSKFTIDHYASLESLLWHIIKPKNSDAFYPETKELFQKTLSALSVVANDISNRLVVSKIWCVLARVERKYVEETQDLNEGSRLEHNFKTIENTLAFPFTHTPTDNQDQLQSMAESWKELYSQFDLEAGLMVSVKPNEVIYKMSDTIIKFVKKNSKCCDLAILCVDGLLSTVNYDHLLIGNEASPFENLMINLSCQSLRVKSFATKKILKSLSTFLLQLFGHNVEKTSVCLKHIQPVIKNMLAAAIDDADLEAEISSTWKSVVGLFKKLHKYLSSDLLNCYRSTIVTAIMHLNKDVSSAALSILDLKSNLDDKSKLVLNEIMSELDKTSVKNCDISETKVKSSKKKSTPVKPIGSFLNRKTMSPSTASSIVQNGKENIKEIAQFEPDSQDFVMIQSDVKFDVNRLTEHQKELLKKRRDDIPAMYNDLSISNSQDTQEIQHWFDARTGKTQKSSSNDEPSNNNEVLRTAPISSFKNITKSLSSDQLTLDKSVISPTKPSPKKQPAASASSTSEKKRQQQQQQQSDASAPAQQQQQQQQQNQPVPKKLDFESQEEFPPQEVSPSIIDNAKMRRKSLNAVNDANCSQTPDSVQQSSKQMRNTRRSLQIGGGGVPLRKSNSTDQLNTRRGTKRRNSETNSEGVLDIEREKRPRRETPDVISEEESERTESCSSDDNNKKISKRQLTEMSRLKIDMVFKPLPSRRSVGKATESTDKTDKKPVAGTSRAQKFMNTLKKETPKDRRSLFKEEDSESQQLVTSRRRTIDVNTISSEDKESSLKKVNYTKTLGKSTARKSLTTSKEPMVVYKKKIEVTCETQEEIYIEDASTPAESIKSSPAKSPSKSPLKTSPDESDITSSESELRSSQDSDVDIVESSQEPHMNSKMDKVECFIKIQKVEVAQAVKAQESKPEKNDVIIESTPAQTDDSSLSIIPATAEFENKADDGQTDSKKVEGASTAKESSSSNYMSSPKTSRLSKSRLFPIRNRAAHMLGLVTQGSSLSISAASTSSSEKSSSIVISSDDISIVPLPKKQDKAVKEFSSPVSSSRQEKMFNNMNNAHIRADRCSSPSITMFCNLRNDGEKVSPKLDKTEKDSEDSEKETTAGDDSPSCRMRRELPMLEWSNANPPSLDASPSASILKRMQESDQETPNRKKRVSFADPPVSREMGYEIITENSSPPRLEKLPSPRSPTSRKDIRRQSKLRMIQVDSESRLEKENQDTVLSNSLEPSSSISITPKMKLSAVLGEIPAEETKVESDMIVNCSVSLSSDDKTPQNDTIKLDTLNMSKAESNHQNSVLEDTVDIGNLTSLNSESNFSAFKSGSQPSSDIGDTLPVTDSVFSNPLSQETQNNEAKLIEVEELNSTLPVYPALVSCSDAIDPVCADLVDPMFTRNLNQHFSLKSIKSVGDLAKLTERDVNRLPVKFPKVECIVKALARYEEKLAIKTPDRRPTPNVSSSTPLNRRRDRAKPVDDTFEIDDLNVSAVYQFTPRPVKRASTDNSMQTSPVKKSKMEQEKACEDIMDQCDEEFLFKTFVNRFGPDKLLEGYKEKMKEKSEKDLKRETLTMLGLNVEDDSEASFEASSKTAGLQKVLKQLPKIFEHDEQFYKSVLKTYKKELKPSEVLKVLKPTELEDAVTEAFDAPKLLKILNKRLENDGCDKLNDSNELQALLNNVLSSSILKQVSKRNELKTSEMFKVVAENFDALELSDMCNEAIKSGIRRLQK